MSVMHIENGHTVFSALETSKIGGEKIACNFIRAAYAKHLSGHQREKQK